jgi:hypothetical protein
MKENQTRKSVDFAENKEDEWYIYNGCSTDMTGYQNKSINLNKIKMAVLHLEMNPLSKYLEKV